MGVDADVEKASLGIVSNDACGEEEMPTRRGGEK